MAGAPRWNEEETRMFVQLWNDGKGLKTIAINVGRTYSACLRMAAKLHKTGKLRRRFGTNLGPDKKTVKRVVYLPPDVDAAVRKHIASLRYANFPEYVRALIRRDIGFNARPDVVLAARRNTDVHSAQEERFSK